MDPISFETHPSRYRHWKLEPPDADGVAKLFLDIDEEHPLKPGYPMKLNSYDLSVDIELADAVQRLRFEHPSARALVITSSKDRIFCSGANIYMLAGSTHPFKVNFCKYTNETRLALEDASQHSGLKSLAACNGPTAGGGYELALACDDIVLIDDGNSTVSLPEVPLLGVLPGTGGLTRVVDKRKVRRDRADVFSTLAEGMKGKRALEWGLVDAVLPRSKFAEGVAARAKKLAGAAKETGPGVVLDELRPEASSTTRGDEIRYRHVTLVTDKAHRSASLTLHAPTDDTPRGIDGLLALGSAWWSLRAFRELDDALLRLRFHYEDIGLVTLHSRGEGWRVLAHDVTMDTHRDHWFVREVRLLQARVLRRLDLTAKSLFAVLDPESCFFGSLLEVALAADRRYALEDPRVKVQASSLNGSAYPMPNDQSRLAALGLSEELAGLIERPLTATEADEAGLVTVLADDIDFADTLRLGIEERLAISPDALTGMEASFRCIGPETTTTKIFGRLSAWQNWIFIRPNSTGERGALSLYGKPERPSFDWRRT